MMLRSFGGQAAPLALGKPRGLWECNRSYYFHGANRYSLMTIGGIRTDLRITYPATSFDAALPACRWSGPWPFHLNTRIWKRSSYPHSTLAVLLDPVATRFREAIPEFANPLFLWTGRGHHIDRNQHSNQSTQSTFSDRAATTLVGLLKYHQTLASTDGQRVATPAAELAWIVHTTSLVMYSTAAEPRIHRAVAGDRKQEGFRPSHQGFQPWLS